MHAKRLDGEIKHLPAGEIAAGNRAHSPLIVKARFLVWVIARLS
jgi:hypothetical protein